MHDYVLSPVVGDRLVLKHQAISLHSGDRICIGPVSYQSITWKKKNVKYILKKIPSILKLNEMLLILK